MRLHHVSPPSLHTRIPHPKMLLHTFEGPAKKKLPPHYVLSFLSLSLSFSFHVAPDVHVSGGDVQLADTLQSGKRSPTTTTDPLITPASEQYPLQVEACKYPPASMRVTVEFLVLGQEMVTI